MAAARVHAPEPAGACVRRLTVSAHARRRRASLWQMCGPRPGLDSGQVWLNNVLVDIYVELDQPEQAFFTGRHGGLPSKYPHATRATHATNTQRATRNVQHALVQHATCNTHSCNTQRATTRRQRAPVRRMRQRGNPRRAAREIRNVWRAACNMSRANVWDVARVPLHQRRSEHYD